MFLNAQGTFESGIVILNKSRKLLALTRAAEHTQSLKKS